VNSHYPIPDSVAAAHADYKFFAEELVRATREAYPVGARVEVTLGVARITGEIIRSGNYWWHDPDRVEIRNVVTGKMRHFSAASQRHNAVLLEVEV